MLVLLTEVDPGTLTQFVPSPAFKELVWTCNCKTE